jgi:16S rRNA (uracil1498-N3)-methyltransferase
MLMRLESKGENSFLREVKVESEPEDRLAMTLMIGLLKSEQFDAVLRASSELGLKSILPVACERSVPRVAELDIRKKVSRWQKILDEGTSVSGALSPPKITAPIKFTEVEWDLLPKKRYAAVIASESRPISSVDDLDGEIVFAVGPEGDWSERESESLLEHGFIPVALGCRIMRASTAAITGCGWFRFMSGHDIFR